MTTPLLFPFFVRGGLSSVAAERAVSPFPEFLIPFSPLSQILLGLTGVILRFSFSLPSLVPRLS